MPTIPKTSKHNNCATGLPLLLGRSAYDQGNSAMVGMTFGAEAPQDVIALGREVDWLVSLGSMTETTGTDILATAIVV